MRFLSCSDIHGNVTAVQTLRRVESNDYDALLVAGDLAGHRREAAGQIFEILDTFECPVLCVYGNWDWEQPYIPSLSEHCRLVHHNVVELEGYFVTGFSGCPTNWGLNPELAQCSAEVDEEYGALLERLAHCQRSISADLLEIEHGHKQKLAKLRAKGLEPELHRKRQRVLRAARTRAEEKAEAPLRALRCTKEHDAYLVAKYDAFVRALHRNRHTLFDTIAPLDPTRTIVLTHERLTRLEDEGVHPLLHIFGHRHQHKVTRRGSTTYVNTAALDDWTKKSAGYCVFEVRDDTVDVQRRNLNSAVEWAARRAA
jgi:Icc-related predicted phosphoesterase